MSMHHMAIIQSTISPMHGKNQYHSIELNAMIKNHLLVLWFNFAKIKQSRSICVKLIVGGHCDCIFL